MDGTCRTLTLVVFHTNVLNTVYYSFGICVVLSCSTQSLNYSRTRRGIAQIKQFKTYMTKTKKKSITKDTGWSLETATAEAYSAQASPVDTTNSSCMARQTDEKS